MATVGIKEARLRFSELIRKASKGQEVIITRRGIPIARVVPTGRLVPLDGIYLSPSEAVKRMQEFPRFKLPRGTSIKKMISEGRR